ncbi:MAG: 50S ribosomal protein L29 [Fimbriimonas sp.]|jgi:large subunit ribosomal protein L29|nr:50S ribosomal protein L29 [Fimbriimonas sp.]
MKSLKAKELRDKSVADLQAMVTEEQAALYKARRDIVFRQLTDTASVKVRRHNVARILTVIGEKQRGNA